MTETQRRRLARMHVDHVGSLLRPESLKEAFRAFGAGRLPRDALEAVQDAAIRAVIARQEEAGLPIVSDGEYRRLNWQVSFSEVAGWDLWGGSWKGFLKNPDLLLPGEKPLSRGEDAVVSFRAPATARLALTRNFLLAEYRFAASVARTPVKAMLMGPDRVAQMCAGGFEPLRFVPLDQLAISPQCGFASGIGGNFLTEDEQWRKLDAMMKVARTVWG
ncbi:MAG: hypothetical protein EHM83_07930 [Burkholderiales bacterium]|nr:MAG: hypothetical protein EHM83_07930 [Burkholderiales bacterium]